MEILLERLTWPEVHEAIEAGFDRVLVMVGSVEQHGPHLPLGTDSVLGYSWGQSIAEELGETLVAPVIRPGFSPHHLGFAGTLSLTEETLQSVLVDSCRSLVESGFKRVILLCSHGGNWPVVYRSEERLRQAMAPQGELITLPAETIQDIEDEVYALLSAEGFGFCEAGIHAGLRETAYMLWVAGSSVRQDTMSEGWVEDDMMRRLADAGSVQQISSSGVLGDPRRATRELGCRLNQLTVELYCRAIARRL